MSVVIAAPGGFATVRQTVEHLARPSAWRDLVLVVVALSPAELRIDDALAGAFARVVRCVEAGPAVSIGPGNAAGIRRAVALSSRSMAAAPLCARQAANAAGFLRQGVASLRRDGVRTP